MVFEDSFCRVLTMFLDVLKRWDQAGSVNHLTPRLCQKGFPKQDIGGVPKWSLLGTKHCHFWRLQYGHFWWPQNCHFRNFFVLNIFYSIKFLRIKLFNCFNKCVCKRKAFLLRCFPVFSRTRYRLFRCYIFFYSFQNY